MLPKTAGTLKKHIMECCLNDCSDFKQVKLDINKHTYMYINTLIVYTHIKTLHIPVFLNLLQELVLSGISEIPKLQIDKVSYTIYIYT